MNSIPFLSPKYSDALLALSDSELGFLTRAILLYSKDGSLPSFSPLDKAVAVAFAFLRADIDEQRARHAARCQRNRENARMRWSRRKSAKQPTKAQPTKTQAPDAAKGQSQADVPPPTSKDAAVNHDALLQYWNQRIGETRSRLPKVSSITPQRRSLIAARLRDHGGDPRVLRNAFERAFRSPWLNGHNPDHWVADFNWILLPANFSRVLEGTFDDHSKPTTPQHAPTPAPPPRPQLSPEQTAVQREQHALERQRLSEQQLRENMLAAIRAAERFPHGHAAEAVAEAYASGTLRRLGIAWTPPQADSTISPTNPKTQQL